MQMDCRYCPQPLMLDYSFILGKNRRNLEGFFNLKKGYIQFKLPEGLEHPEAND